MHLLTRAGHAISAADRASGTSTTCARCRSTARASPSPSPAVRLCGDLPHRGRRCPRSCRRPRRDRCGRMRSVRRASLPLAVLVDAAGLGAHRLRLLVDEPDVHRHNRQRPGSPAAEGDLLNAGAPAESKVTKCAQTALPSAGLRVAEASCTTARARCSPGSATRALLAVGCLPLRLHGGTASAASA